MLDGKLRVVAGEEVRELEGDGFAYFPPEQGHECVARLAAHAQSTHQRHPCRLSSAEGATVLMYEQRYVEPAGAMATVVNGSRPRLLFGTTDAQPLLPVSPEVFALRKLLPTTPEYDFNMHVMDFEPGEYLIVKEVHYNQHGLLLLEGQGIYRLADKWCVGSSAYVARRGATRAGWCIHGMLVRVCLSRYPVTAGDAIWMAPFVVQWYGALGKTRSRCVRAHDNAAAHTHAHACRLTWRMRRYIINKDTNRGADAAYLAALMPVSVADAPVAFSLRRPVAAVTRVRHHVPHRVVCAPCARSVLFYECIGSGCPLLRPYSVLGE